MGTARRGSAWPHLCQDCQLKATKANHAWILLGWLIGWIVFLFGLVCFFVCLFAFVFKEAMDVTLALWIGHEFSVKCTVLSFGEDPKEVS